MQLPIDYFPKLPIHILEPSAEPRELKPLLVTIRQASQLLALAEQTIRQMCYTGELASVKHGKALRVVYADLERWVEEKSNGPTWEG